MGFLASTYDQSKYLRAEDITKRTKVRIKAATEEELIGGLSNDRQKKAVIWFTSLEKGLVLNKINLRALMGAFGDHTDGWIGKVIELFTMMTDVRGQLKNAIRVQIPPPKTATAPAPQPQPSSGNGAAAPQPATTPPAPAQAPAVDPELEPETLDEETGDAIPF